MIVGLVLGMATVIKADDIPDWVVAVGCILGFGSFVAGIVDLVVNTK